MPTQKKTGSGAGKAANPEKAGKPTPPPKSVKLSLPVTLTPERRAALGAELAEKNGLGRVLKKEKATKAAHFRVKLEVLDGERVQIEEALKTSGEQTVTLDVLCEARPSSDGKDMFDIFRMDTTPPSFVKAVYLPPKQSQTALALGDSGVGEAPVEDEAAQEEQLRADIAAQLKDVAFPNDDETGEPPPPSRSEPGKEAQADDNDDEGDHFSTSTSTPKA